jgi:hypothetical protein
MYDHQTHEKENQGLLQTVFEDGKLIHFETLADIRERLHGNKE